MNNTSIYFIVMNCIHIYWYLFSVAIILFNTTNKKMIFVKQFRPGIWFTLNCIQESLFIKTCSIESCLLQFNP